MRSLLLASAAVLATVGAVALVHDGADRAHVPITVVPGRPAAPTSAPIAAMTLDAGRYRPAPARKPTTGVSLRLGKCINLSNMLEAPNEGDWGRAFRDSDMRTIASHGFTGVRIPVRFLGHAGTAPPYTIDPVFMARVKHVVGEAAKNNVAAIIDMHHYQELFDDPGGQTDRFAAMWRQVATAFRDAPDTVVFELINEPQGNLTKDNLLSVIRPALAAIRETNTRRPVIVDGENYANLAQLPGSPMPDDPYVVPTFHFYDPNNFAFESAPWMQPASRDDYGTPADFAALDASVQALVGYMDRTGRVPFVGEYGAWEGRPTDRRALYYASVTGAFASVGVQSCAWGYTNTFDLHRDDTGWEKAVLRGIVTTKTLPK